LLSIITLLTGEMTDCPNTLTSGCGESSNIELSGVRQVPIQTQLSQTLNHALTIWSSWRSRSIYDEFVKVRKV
jgi:hypothetical protein